MKYSLYLTFCIFLFVFSASSVKASTFEERVQGHILIDVESHGQAWYVDPDTDLRHYLGRPDDAFDVMKGLGLGILDSDLGLIPVEGDDTSEYSDEVLSERLAGKILIQVQSKGEAWYVHPDSHTRIYLGSPEQAFEVMRSYGLGISSNDLRRILPAVLGSDAQEDVFAGYRFYRLNEWDNNENAYTFENAGISYESMYYVERRVRAVHLYSPSIEYYDPIEWNGYSISKESRMITGEGRQAIVSYWVGEPLPDSGLSHWKVYLFLGTESETDLSIEFVLGQEDVGVARGVFETIYFAD